MAARDFGITASTAKRAAVRGELSLVRLYMLRACYLLLVVGLGAVIWPDVLRHTNEFAVRWGIQTSLLAGMGLGAVVGLRYPVKMLPLLLFELLWKTIYLVAFALPLWLGHAVDAKAAGDIQSVLVVVVFLPLIPWGYVWREFLVGTGERWR